MRADKVPLTGFPFPPARGEAPDLWAGAGLAEEQLRMLAVGAFYARSNHAFYDTLSMLPEQAGPATRREKAIESLADPWSVTSAGEATGTLNHLLAGMHAPNFAIVHPLAQAGAAATARDTWTRLPDQHRAFLRQVATVHGMDDLDREYDNWTQAIKFGFVNLLPQPLNTDATAWDLARLVHVTRLSYTAGYLDEAAAWDILARGLAETRRHYCNWRQFSAGFLTGGLFWLCYDLSQARGQTRTRLGVIRGLHLRPDSPWRRVALRPGDAASLVPGDGQQEADGLALELLVGHHFELTTFQQRLPFAEQVGRRRRAGADRAHRALEVTVVVQRGGDTLEVFAPLSAEHQPLPAVGDPQHPDQPRPRPLESRPLDHLERQLVGDVLGDEQQPRGRGDHRAYGTPESRTGDLEHATRLGPAMRVDHADQAA